MNKRQVIAGVRDVMCGNSGHTMIAFGKNENNKWETATTTSRLSSDDFPEWKWVSIQKHCCNEITIKKAERIVEDAENYHTPIYTKEFFQKKGKEGGLKSKRKLTAEEASRMGKLSAEKRKLKKEQEKTSDA